MQGEDDNGSSCDYRAGSSLQAPDAEASSSSSSAAAAASPSLLDEAPHLQSADEPKQDLVHVQCWGPGFAGQCLQTAGAGHCKRVALRACKAQAVWALRVLVSAN